MKKNTQKKFKKFKKNNHKRTWGENAEKYNTVGSTIMCCKYDF
jgi:hypothetical protein